MELPLSFSDFIVWIAAMAVLLLLTSDILSIAYEVTNIYIDKKRLEKVSLTFGIFFLFLIILIKLLNM
jgi:hypothetical protein